MMRAASRGTGRRRLRSPAVLRRRPYLLPTLGAALLVGGLIGVQLGESAIAGINPIHFAGEPEPPRAVQPPAPIPAQATYLDAYNWGDGQSARAADCGDCVTSHETYAYAQGEPAPRLVGQDWRDPTGTAEPEPWPPGQVAIRRGGEVMRYADYPIEQKPAEAKPADPRADYQDADIYEADIYEEVE